MIFYDLRNQHQSCVDYGLGNDWEGIVCPVNDGHQRAGRRTTELRLELLSKKIVDFSWTILSDIVITDKVVELFKSEGLTGYELRSAPIVESKVKWDNKEYPRFWELIVTGQGGHAHPDSGIRLKLSCETCGLVEYSAFEHGIIANEETWDGSDLFYVVEYPRHILVKEEVKDLIEDHKLTNVGFIKSNELTWPEGVVKP